MTRASNDGYLSWVTLDGDERPWPLSEIVEVDELAAMLGIKPGTIRQHLNAGTGTTWLPRPAGKVAGAWVFIRSQIDLATIQAARVPRGRHAPKPSADAPAADVHTTATPSTEPTSESEPDTNTSATAESGARPEIDDGWWPTTDQDPAGP